MFLQDEEEHVNFSSGSENEDWMEAVKSVLSVIEKNKTWSLVEFPKNKTHWFKMGVQD